VFSGSLTAVLPEGTYTANRSSTANGILENANASFDYVDNAVWSSASNTYDATNDVYIGAATTLVDGVAVLGEFIDITVPMSIKAEKINIFATKRSSFDAQTRSPRNFIVAAVVNNLWTSVLQHTNALGWTMTQTRQFALASPVSSNRYRLIIQQVGNDALYISQQHRVEIAQLTFETALTSALDDVREKDAHIKKVMGYDNMPEVWKSGGDETTTLYAQGSMALDQTVRLSLATGVTIAQELGTEPSLASNVADVRSQLGAFVTNVSGPSPVALHPHASVGRAGNKLDTPFGTYTAAASSNDFAASTVFEPNLGNWTSSSSYDDLSGYYVGDSETVTSDFGIGTRPESPIVEQGPPAAGHARPVAIVAHPVGFVASEALTLFGEWIELQLPFATAFKSVHMTPNQTLLTAQTSSPRSFALLYKTADAQDVWNTVFFTSADAQD
jgi:hypothetical protein